MGAKSRSPEWKKKRLRLVEESPKEEKIKGKRKYTKHLYEKFVDQINKLWSTLFYGKVKVQVAPGKSEDVDFHDHDIDYFLNGGLR